MKDGKRDKLKAIKESCKAMKPDGSSCQAAALPGSGFCFFHDPTKAEDRRAAQSAGGSQGRIKTLPEDAPDVKIEDCQDVAKLIAQTINQVRRGELDPRVANAVGYLANVLIKAVEQGDHEKRLEELEALISNRSTESYLSGEISID